MTELSSGSIKRSYTWGPDLSGSLQGAGGIGGLVFVRDTDTSGSYYSAYDGNGNLTAMISSSTGTAAAKYEYSPYGELLTSTGTYAGTNPFRFSTKYTDSETGLAYFGYRYYNPETGRWLNRDPIGEEGGWNLYAYVHNDPIMNTDSLGLCEKTLSFTGHGMSTQCDMNKKLLAKCECIPEFMTNGIADGSPILTTDDITAACDSLCPNATLNLYACGIGKNEAFMKALAAGCPKIKKVCGYTRILPYIPWTEITLPMPWNWNCIDVN
jgi:RHS repeat-associated protein